MQAAKYFAEYFASAWERKEAEVAAAAAALHRSEVWARARHMQVGLALC